ncbi:gluconate 2-dehydrogenase subunit 3 family protein [Roseateles sp.]|uniref:gluconate 2-dehydrogenase subunit 3 family protein n=1 Tax=Roseateles sp. TaxID=1971397 RepID=UPI0039E9E967
MGNNDSGDIPARRGFLKQVAGGAVASGVAIVSPIQCRAQADDTAMAATAGDVAPGYICFGPREAAFVETLVNTMCPADQFTPAGVDCGLAVFIDRQLAGDYGRGARRYMNGPWKQGKAEMGYQLPMTPQRFFFAGIEAVDAACQKQYGKAFDSLAPADAEAVLQAVSAGKLTHEELPLGAWFNELVYPLFTQACFADPIYGGNAGKVFWKLVGYPGLPATHAIDVIQYRGKPFPGAKDPKSIADFS